MNLRSNEYVSGVKIGRKTLIRPFQNARLHAKLLMMPTTKGGYVKVLVTGGAGFIGSHVASQCQKMGATVVVLDDCSGGFE